MSAVRTLTLLLKWKQNRGCVGGFQPYSENPFLKKKLQVLIKVQAWECASINHCIKSRLLLRNILSLSLSSNGSMYLGAREKGKGNIIIVLDYDKYIYAMKTGNL